MISPSRIRAARDEQWQRPACDSILLRLPTPPSVNALWRRGKQGVTRSGKKRRGMIHSPAYDAWKAAAGIYINQRKPGRISGWFTVTILIGWTRAGKDIDNHAKAIMDLLQEHGVIENDSWAWQVTIGWSLDVEGAEVSLDKLPSSSSLQAVA